MELDLHGIIELQGMAKQAAAMLERGRYTDAVQLYLLLCAEANVIEPAYDEWLRGLRRALTMLGRRREAAYVSLYLYDFEQAHRLIDEAERAAGAQDELALDRARLLVAQERHQEGAQRYAEQGRWVQAAVAFEHAGEQATPADRNWTCGSCGAANVFDRRLLPICAECSATIAPGEGARQEAFAGARRCWERLRTDDRLRDRPYEGALVHFNLGTCALNLGDPEGMGHLVTSQRLLEEAADGFETGGHRERAFDCYQILLELGRRSGAFENLAEGFLNCIRILKEDNLKYYVLQYYEDFLGEALGREEFHAAASLYREAADFSLRSGMFYDRYYMKRAAETWLLAAGKTLREGGPAEMAENAGLAAVDCFNAVGDYGRVREAYAALAELELGDRRRARYRRIAERFANAPALLERPPAFPEYLRQPHAYPDIWYADLVEWEHDGDVVAICAAVLGVRRFPDVVRRRALNLLLMILQDEATDLARVAEQLGELQIYDVLSALEALYQTDDAAVQQGVMRAVQYLFFKRSFVVLGHGLTSERPAVRHAAIESLGRLHFNHAFDPLVRIFRETDDPSVRRTALRSIGMIPQLQAGDFLLEVLRYEDEPLRGDAKRLLTSFQNPEIFPILRQQQALESGALRADLDEILRQARV